MVVTRQVVSSIPIRINDIFNIFIFFALVIRQHAVLSFVAQHAVLSEIGGKWETGVLWETAVCRIQREAKKILICG